VVVAGFLSFVRAQILAALVVAVAAAPPQVSTSPSASDLARAIQQKYDTVKDLSASFVHSYRGGVLRKEATERGTVKIKKPGRMRWVYEYPERKEFVADGSRIYSYIPEDRQVMVAPVPADGEATTPALFLSGHGNLARDFAASFPDAPDPLPGTWSLTLTPLRPEAEYESLTLVVDRATYRLRKLVTADVQGGRSTFTFSDVRENVGMPDALFRFTIPRGVDVVTNGQAGR
jgi:outer membrane lipoprotein carrier protein